MSGKKAYFIVETDERNVDPLSRLVSEALGKLKNDPCCKTFDPPENMGSLFATIPLRNPPAYPNSSKNYSSKPRYEFKQIIPSEYSPMPFQPVPSTKICSMPISGPSNGLSNSIVAAATVDSTGNADTKMWVNSDPAGCSQGPPLCPAPPPCVRSYPLCERRNGLEPELRSGKKVYYLPVPPPIVKPKCPYRPSILADNLSTASINSRSSGYYPNRHLPMVAEMKKCAKNIPEKRLIKYNACINRRDGMQDFCDPLSRKALKKC